MNMILNIVRLILLNTVLPIIKSELRKNNEIDIIVLGLQIDE